MNFEETYITVKGWMSSVLGLSGNELLAFALVYGFSQDGQSEARSSISYIQKWLNCSRPTAIATMNKLNEKQYVLKRQDGKSGKKRNYYRANLGLISSQLKNFTSKETLLGSSKKTLPVASKETLPSIYNSNIDSNTKAKSEDLSKDVFERIKGLKEKIGPKHYSILNEACQDKESENYKRAKGMFKDGRFNFLMDWLEFKKQTKKGLKAKGSITELINLFWDHTPNEMKQAVKTAKANGYSGLFPKKLSDKQVSQQGAKVRNILSKGRRKADVI